MFGRYQHFDLVLIENCSDRQLWIPKQQDQLWHLKAIWNIALKWN